jgi:hypothetical protein
VATPYSVPFCSMYCSRRSGGGSAPLHCQLTPLRLLVSHLC